MCIALFRIMAQRKRQARSLVPSRGPWEWGWERGTRAVLVSFHKKIDLRRLIGRTTGHQRGFCSDSLQPFSPFYTVWWNYSVRFRRLFSLSQLSCIVCLSLLLPPLIHIMITGGWGMRQPTFWHASVGTGYYFSIHSATLSNGPDCSLAHA